MKETGKDMYEIKVDFPHAESPRRRMVMLGGSSIIDSNNDMI